MGKILNTHFNQKKPAWLYMSEIVGKARSITRGKEGCCIMLKGWIQQEDNNNLKFFRYLILIDLKHKKRESW